MDYRIVAANAEIGQIQVTYLNNAIEIATYTIDVPVINGAFITGEALEAEIQSRAPVWLLQRTQEVQVATGFDLILAQVQTPIVTLPEITDPSTVVDIVPNTQVL